MQTSTDFQIDLSTPVPWYQMERDMQLRMFGWALLFLWIATVVYMTRDFFFPRYFRPTNEQTISRVASFRSARNTSKRGSQRSKRRGSKDGSVKSTRNVSRAASQRSNKNDCQKIVVDEEEMRVEINFLESAKKNVDVKEKCVIEIAEE